MSEDTTTSDSVDSGADEAQLESQEIETEAETQGEDTSQTSESGDESESDNDSDDSEEAELKDWAAKKNLPLDNPLALAKMYRESEKKLGTKGNREGQLKTAVSTANASSGTDEMQALRNEVDALSFWVNHPGAKEQYEGNMVDILEEKPWLASDLESVLDIAKGRSVTDAAALLAANKAGKKEALTTAEQAGRAAQPKASATNSAKATNARITLDNVDGLIAQNGHQWYLKNRDKINEVMANG